MSRWIQMLAPAENETDQERHEFLRRAIRASFTNAWLVAVDSVAGTLVFEDGNETLWQADFTIGADNAVTFGQPVAVRRVTTFQPLTSAPGGVPVTVQARRPPARHTAPEEFDYHKEQAAIDRAEARAFNATTKSERELAELEVQERKAWIRHHDEQMVAFPVVNILDGARGSSVLDRTD